MLRLVSLNLNGIRSAANKGWLSWVESVAADCMGVQEVRAQAADVATRLVGDVNIAHKEIDLKN